MERLRTLRLKPRGKWFQRYFWAMKDLEMIPTIGGEPDLAQYLQIVPGVIFTGDQGGQLYIRGGSPVQNKVLLDGMIIYSPFHSIGLF